MITRYRALKEVIKRLNEPDVAVFVGKQLCEEAYVNDREGSIYITDPMFPAMSFTSGLSMATEKRIFLFTSDSYFLRDISSLAQMAVSNCKNVTYVLLSSGVYIEAGKHPNIFKSMMHPQGVLFRMGFTSFIFDNYFDNVVALGEMKGMLDTLIGPVAILINVSDKSSNSRSLDKSFVYFRDRLIKFIATEETAMFEPPQLDSVDLLNL